MSWNSDNARLLQALAGRLPDAEIGARMVPPCSGRTVRAYREAAGLRGYAHKRRGLSRRQELLIGAAGLYNLTGAEETTCGDLSCLQP